MTMLPAATQLAREVDWLLAALLLATIMVLGLVFGLMFLYIVRYRHDSGLDRGRMAQKTWKMEVGWTSATLLAFFGLFIWGANLFVRIETPQGNPLTIHVIGKQWMWKVEYPGGQREINALHVPAGQDVQLLLTSEDVIHDFGVPALRLKRDVLPGRLEPMLFRADTPGHYHLFCNQFCGTDHASMVGWVHVLSPPDYQNWLSHTGTDADLVAEGHTLFIRNGCSGCHQNGLSGGGGTVRAPSLNGLFGSPVPLADGSVITADDRYIHDSILQPGKQVVASYPPVMPSFAGVIGEEDLLKIIAYLKSLPANGTPQ